MIEFKNVSHFYDGAPVLRGLNLTLRERRIGIIGPNGSGKSTLARLLIALITPSKGEVTVHGLSTRANAIDIRRKIGLVFQNPEHQIVMPTVEEDIAFGPRNMGAPKPEIERRMAALLDGYGLAAKRRHAAHLLSGGEKKLLTLLSVLVMEPECIVFDEPLNSLDLPSRRKIAKAIDGLAQMVIAITHDLELIAHYDRAIWLQDGSVAEDGKPDDVIRRYSASF